MKTEKDHSRFLIEQSLIEMKMIRKVRFCFAVKQRNDRGGSLTQRLFAPTSYTVACSDLQIFVLCPSFVHFMCPQFWLHQEAFETIGMVLNFTRSLHSFCHWSKIDRKRVPLNE